LIMVRKRRYFILFYTLGLSKRCFNLSSWACRRTAWQFGWVGFYWAYYCARDWSDILLWSLRNKR